MLPLWNSSVWWSVTSVRHNSGYTHLLQKNPNLQLLKCVCYSIQLCVSKAVETLPCNLDYLVSHSCNWFSHSAFRRREYAKIYSLINPGEAPLMLIQMSNTQYMTAAHALVKTNSDAMRLRFCFRCTATQLTNCISSFWCRFSKNSTEWISCFNKTGTTLSKCWSACSFFPLPYFASCKARTHPKFRRSDHVAEFRP